jgi:hypothetical protein
MYVSRRNDGVGGITYHDLGYLALRYIGQRNLLHGHSLPGGPIEGT